MKLQTFKSLHEINLDHLKTCEHCGKSYEVIQRAYGMGAYTTDNGIGSRFIDAQGSADKGSHKKALLEKAKLLPYHRCTECGLYGYESIDQMKDEGYRIFLKRSRETWRSILLGFLAFLGGLTYCIIERKAVAYLIIMIAFSAFFGWAAIAGRPKSKKAWDIQVESMNSPEIVLKWQEKWNDSLAKESRRKTKDSDIAKRRSAWNDVARIQHYLDPFWKFYQF